MALAWLLIAAKCALVWWAVDKWTIPFHPAWIVGPTLVFAAIASALWAFHQPEAGAADTGRFQSLKSSGL